MPIKGVTKEQELIIKSIIEPYKGNLDFYYYGSRVKGNYRLLSDLDIMVKGSETVKIDCLNELKDKFDKSNLPYVVNLSDYSSIDEHFYKIIEQDLVKIN